MLHSYAQNRNAASVAGRKGRIHLGRREGLLQKVEKRNDRKKREKERKRRKMIGKKDGPGPVMVSDTLCPAVHILGT